MSEVLFHMAKSAVRELTQGSPMKLVIGFTLPLMFGFLFQQFYSFVDAAIVGRFLGAQELAAVGSTGSLNFVILGLTGGMCSGFAVPIAQAVGAKDETELRRNVFNAAYLCTIISVVMGVVTGLLTGTMLRWLSTPADIIVSATKYFRLILWTLPVMVLYNMSSAILRSLGDSKTPVMFLVMASIINIVLDLVFIIVFHMGVQGAALATAVSQLASGVGCLMTLVKRFPILRPREGDTKYRPNYCRRLVLVGLPMGLQFSITGLGSLVLTSSVNVLGTVYVAASTAGGKMSAFFCTVIDALASTMATYAGQNLGARKLDRIHQGLKAASIVGCIYCVAALIVILLAGKPMMTMFVDASETEVLNYAQQYLTAFGTFYIPLFFVNIVRLTIQGMGYTRLAVIAGVLEMIARGVVGAVFVPIFGFSAACLASPSAWILADAFLFPAYFAVMKKLRQRLQPAGVNG